MARLAVYGAISTVLAGAVIASAFAQRSNFYAACIYLYKSNACMMIILNLGLFLTIVAGQLVQLIFFGNLRTLEVEHLYERAWYAVTETCLAMTIFKDEFDTRFVVMFTLLLFLKVFHWLCQDRVDSMEQSPGLPVSFHVRMVTMISLLVTIDVLLVLHAADMVSIQRPNMMIMFGFEYTLLATNLLASFGKYVLHTIDMRREDPWENKSMLLFYLDLVADFIKLVTYLIFFMVILVCYGLPLHIIRDVYMTMRSFAQKCKDLIQYRKATRNMNERYPDATRAELAALSDPICIICREEMVGTHGHTLGHGGDGAQGQGNGARAATGSTSNVPKKLPCGHIFHFHCLKSWLERQQSCPTCRRLVLDPPTPTPTPTVAPAGDAQGAGAAAAPGAGLPAGGMAGPGHQLGAGAPHANGPHVPGQPGAAQAGFIPNHGVGFPMMFAHQGHFAHMGGWPQVPPGGAAAPGAAPPPGTPAAAGTSTPGALPATPPHAIPHYTVPNVTHPIPGLIPLFPVQPFQHLVGGVHGGFPGAGVDGVPRPGHNIWAHPSSTGPQPSGAIGASSSGESSSNTSSEGGLSGSQSRRTATVQFPLTSLEALTEDQLRYLEQNTRRGLQERLRVLQALDNQIVESITVLTQALGALTPTTANTFRTEATEVHADPPSPPLGPSAAGPSGTSSSGAGAGSASASTSTATRSWAFGSAAGPPFTSTSQVGLQSVAATTTTTDAASTKGSTSTSTISSTAPVVTATPAPASTASPLPAVTSTLVEVAPTLELPATPTAALTVNGEAHEAAEAASEIKASSEFESDEELVMQHPITSADKGKGKKTDSEEEKDSTQKEEYEVKGAATEKDTSDESDDEKYSPQEMVRRRWAKMDVSSTAASLPEQEM